MNRQPTTDNRQQFEPTFFPVRLLVVGCMLFVAPILVSAYTFSRDLKLGDSGDDVHVLQQLLNSNAQTKIAASGPGAPGEETTYFGPKTKAAVIRFQEQNASKILTPLGLFAGTGYVGAATRAILGSQTFSATKDTTASSQSFADALAAFQNTASDIASGQNVVVSPPDGFTGPFIGALAKEYGAEDMTITITGSGFTAQDNTIHTNHGVFEDISSSNGTTLSFTIEKSSLAANTGTLDGLVYVENKNGKSAPVFFTLGW